MMRGRDEDPERGSPSSESPLRQALGGKTPSSSTPILSASLNAPPMLNERSGLDLSRLGFTRSRDPDEEEDTARKNGGLYKHLISQLQSGPPKRLRPSLSSRFQCPVCRKRFQRHIALNAHFQSEHIGEDSLSKEKSCKICQTRLSASDPSTIRLHLLSAHRIDLENPAACLISDDVGSANVGSTTHAGSKYSVLRASLSSSPDDESSVGSSSSSSSSSSISSASSERLFLHEEAVSDAKHHQKDLIGNNNNNNNNHNNSNNSGSLKKRRKPSRPSGEVSSAGTSPPWQCIHCSIIFPNQTLYFLHKGFHGEVSDPFRCNGCGMACSDMYDFNTHLMSDPHH